MQEQPICAVLTGDLIKSRKASTSAVEATLDILRDAAATFGKASGLDLRFTRYRGDGWQMALTQPAFLLDAALYIIARLKSDHSEIDTRISIGVGPVENIGTRDLADATGQAFFVSGDQLDQMTRGRIIALAGPSIGPAQVAIADLSEFVAISWTATQAQAIAFWLTGNFNRHEDIATQLGVTRQAIQSRLSGAGLAYLDSALYAMSNHDFSKDIGASQC